MLLSCVTLINYCILIVLQKKIKNEIFAIITGINSRTIDTAMRQKINNVIHYGVATFPFCMVIAMVRAMAITSIFINQSIKFQQHLQLY